LEFLLGESINIYCDESCHLERDGHRSMVLGGVWCPKEKSPEIAKRIREIKSRHRLSTSLEIKWSKVSPAKVQFYSDLVDYFFDDDDLHFRAVIIPDKNLLHHAAFDQDHDTWYYKMFYVMLQVLFEPGSEYFIYLDTKDTKSAAKVRTLHDVLASKQRDFQRKVVRSIQTVNSSEVEQMQLADLLIGAVSFVNRELPSASKSSSAKRGLVERIKDRAQYDLNRTTLYKEPKFNLFRWEASQPASWSSPI
jgi:hypothetical protein